MPCFWSAPTDHQETPAGVDIFRWHLHPVQMADFLHRLASLFGHPQPAPAPPAAPVSTPTSASSMCMQGDWLSMDQPWIHGIPSWSPDGRFAVVAMDWDPSSSRGGMRESGNGSVFVVDWPARSIHYRFDGAERPMGAAVANDGSCAIQDGLFGHDLMGDLVVLDAQGQERYRRHFDANLFSAGISACGRYAVVQSCAAENPDGNVLEAADTIHQQVLFSVNPQADWGLSFTLDVDDRGELQRVLAHIRKAGAFAYDAHGNFIDLLAYLDTQMASADRSLQVFGAQRLFGVSEEPRDIEKILSVLDAVLADLPSDMAGWAGSIQRTRGECFERLGHPAQALDAYDRALAAKPGIGVKRRAAALRKQLGRA